MSNISGSSRIIDSGLDGDGGQSVVPEHLNTSDFQMYNTTPEMTQMFQMTLDRLQTSTTGDALVGQQWIDGVRVVMNPFDGVVAGNKLPDDIKAQIQAHPGIDFYDAGTHAIYYNPYSAVQVKDDSGKIIGVNSPDVGYGHEVSHSIDPQSIAHLVKEPIGQYPNVGEWLAGQYEKMLSRELGEVERTNHRGDDVLVDNPSTRTAVVNGETVWVKTNPNGQIEIGHKYDFQKIEHNWDAPGEAPKFGSQDPGHATDYNHPSPHDENGGPVINFPENGYDQGGVYHDGDDSGNGNSPDGSGSTGSGDSGQGGSASGGGDDGGNDFPFDWGDGSGGSNGDGLPGAGDDAYNGAYDDPNYGQTDPYDPNNDPSIPAVSRPQMVVSGSLEDGNHAPDSNWVPWNGQIETGGGGGSKPLLEQTSSDDPNVYHAMSIAPPAGNLTDAPTDLTGGTLWLQQWMSGDGHLPGLSGLPVPEPMPWPMPGPDVLVLDPMPAPMPDPLIGQPDLYITQLVGVTPMFDGFGGV